MLVTETEKLTRDKLGGAIAQDLSDILAPNTEGAKKSVPESLVASLNEGGSSAIHHKDSQARPPPPSRGGVDVWPADLTAGRALAIPLSLSLGLSI